MKEKAKFYFGNIVVVDEDQIGVIVKSWEAPLNRPEEGYSHEVYVRSYNSIRAYKENEIDHYIYSKELHEDEYGFY